MNRLNKYTQISGKYYSSVIIKVDSLEYLRNNDILWLSNDKL